MRGAGGQEPAGNLVSLVLAPEVLSRQRWEGGVTDGSWEWGILDGSWDSHESVTFVKVGAWLCSFPCPFPLEERQQWQGKGLCCLCLVPALGAVLLCSFSPSVPESFCAGGQEGKGLCPPVCPEVP